MQQQQKPTLKEQQPKEIQTQQETKGYQLQYQENMKEKHVTPRTKLRQIIIAGDSIIKGLKGWMMARDNRVKVHSFLGPQQVK